MTSGEVPTYIIMGTTTGATSAHCADPDVMNRLSTATMHTKNKKSRGLGRSIACSRFEPWMAVHEPRFDHSNQARNCEAAKNSTSVGMRVFSPRAMKSGTSVASLMLRVMMP